MQNLGVIAKTTGWSLFASKENHSVSQYHIIDLVLQIYAPTSKAEEAEVEWFYEDLQDLLELIPKTDVLFIIGD